MFLVDHEIEKLCLDGNKVRIDPYTSGHVGPNSYDLTLDGEYFLQYLNWGREIEKPWEMDQTQVVSTFALDRHVPPAIKKLANPMPQHNGPARHFLEIPSFHSIIVRTQEIVTIGEGYMGMISARSNLSYVLNMFNSSVVDSGFIGRLSARIYNPTMSDIWIPAGQRIMQLMIAKTNKSRLSYSKRSLSKNLQYSVEMPNYKIDKEWLGFREPPTEEPTEPPTPTLR